MKKQYLITYDLNSKGQDYDNVIKAIKDASDGCWATYWKSSFLIRSNHSTANEIFETIKPYLDPNDRLIIMEVTSNYQGWLNEKQWEYVNNTIF